MKYAKNAIKGLTLPILAFVVYLFMGAVSIYMPATIKSDGSGTIDLTYSAKESDVNDNKYIIGTFPFGEDKVKEYFSSADIKINKLQVSKKDGIYYVVVNFDFKDFNKLSDLKAFSNTKSSWTKNEGGGVKFDWTIKADNSGALNKIEKINYIITFESPVKSSNGQVKDKTVTWYRDSKNTDFAKGTSIDAVIDAPAPTTSTTSSGSNTPGSTPPSSGGKSCGLFGIELPLIMMGLALFSLKKKK